MPGCLASQGCINEAERDFSRWVNKTLLGLQPLTLLPGYALVRPVRLGISLGRHAGMTKRAAFQYHGITAVRQTLGAAGRRWSYEPRVKFVLFELFYGSINR